MTKKQKIIFQLIVLVLLILLAIRPLALKLNDNLTARKQLTKKAAQLTDKWETLNGIEPDLIDKRVKRMEAVFPSVKPIVSLLASLSQLAGEHNLTFGGLSLSPGSLSEAGAKSKNKKQAPIDLNDLSFSFQVGGDFARISQFMQALENTAPLMKIESVALTIKTNPLFEREKTMVVADISVAAYYQAPPATLGSIDKPVRLLTKTEEVLLNQLVGFRTFPPVVSTAAVGKENLFE